MQSFLTVYAQPSKHRLCSCFYDTPATLGNHEFQLRLPTVGMLAVFRNILSILYLADFGFYWLPEELIYMLVGARERTLAGDSTPCPNTGNHTIQPNFSKRSTSFNLAYWSQMNNHFVNIIQPAFGILEQFFKLNTNIFSRWYSVDEGIFWIFRPGSQ